jgi:hypothetical protein
MVVEAAANAQFQNQLAWFLGLPVEVESAKSLVPRKAASMHSWQAERVRYRERDTTYIGP